MKQSIKNVLVKHYAGSIAYGTNLPTSDVDFRGIFVADPISIRTPFFPVMELSDSSEEDTKYYELSQFVKLAVDCNPNIIETLWVDPVHVVHSTPAYELLRRERAKMLSVKVAYTTAGYALSQLKRIKGHHKWINQPQPVQPPQQKDYMSLVHNFTADQIFKLSMDQISAGYRLVPYSANIYGVYQADNKRTFVEDSGALITDYDGNVHELGTPHFIVKYNAGEYTAARDTWSNYWTWKRERNASRSALEEAHGYDTKHAMHLVRLERMGYEALTQGVINVKRPDAQELLEIRGGKWSYDELLEYAEDMDSQIQNLVKSGNHVLAARVNLHEISQLIIEVQDMIWSTK